MDVFSTRYCHSLNSSDLSDPDLPLVTTKAFGGTMAMWRKEYDPFVTVHQSPTSSILPLVFDHPDLRPSVHLTIYLPTAGREAEFVDALAHLANIIDEMKEIHPNALLFIRGDANVNPANKTRSPQLDHFCKSIGLNFLDLHHPTYHHFTGNGISDSQLDIILTNSPDSEKLEAIHCKNENPLIFSHHDLILSSFKLPSLIRTKDQAKNITAPRVPNDRTKITWSTEGIAAYKQLVSSHLPLLRSQWSEPSSSSSFSVLLSSTNSILSMASAFTNKSTSLNKALEPPPVKKPHAVSRSHNLLLSANRSLKRTLANSSASSKSIASARNLVTQRRKSHRRLVRSIRSDYNIRRDQKLHSILTSNPSSVHRSLRSLKSSRASQIQKLTVGNKIYTNNDVPDGFFDSLTALKTHDSAALRQSENLMNLFEDYDNIVEICLNGPKIPHISLKESNEILFSIKPSVNDLYSITAYHYIHAGDEGLEHFNCLLNILVTDINFVTVPEMNSVYSCIFYKGHKKDRTSDRSYRTISTCPLLAKALDIYIRILNNKLWNSQQADTQYQGEGSSHELAALLLTEAIQYSLFSSSQPLYVLYLDARSAYDRVVPEFLIRNLFQSGTSDQSLLYINERLRNRLTFCEWDSNLMGPIADTQGVEQGGVNSDQYYKLTNNEQLSMAQDSQLGVPMANITISAIGFADDAALLSNDPQSLRYLHQLTTDYCSRYCVDLVPEKTKLQLFLPKSHLPFEKHLTSSSPIMMNSKEISYVNHAEHVGVVRSTCGNLPSILDRVSAHKRALGAVLSAGLGRRHRSNPAAGLQVNLLHGTPVLLSGLATLVLKNQEVDILNKHYMKTLQNLQRLYDKTPDCVVAFLGGHLPGKAELHLRQLSLFGMISRLPNDVLHHHAVNVLTAAKPSSNSWFLQIQDLCLMYHLPHPLIILDSPPKKFAFKRLVKSHVIDYWERKLREEANPKTSLAFFKPQFMSLSSPHPLWLTAGSNPYEVNKATVQARMLSGRYRTEALCSHWTSNTEGGCLLPSCTRTITLEDVGHILLECESLRGIRTKMESFIAKYISTRNNIYDIAKNFLFSDDLNAKTQFLLDCSCSPDVITSSQLHGNQVLIDLFYLTRTWCYALHRERLRLLGRWHGN